jgi:hypothetical protein
VGHLADRFSLPGRQRNDPLPSYAGSLCDIDAFAKDTPDAHARARPRRKTGLPAEREALVSIRSIVFPESGEKRAMKYNNFRLCK